MVYLYDGMFAILDVLESEILSSSIADAYLYLRWDEDTAKLQVVLNRELGTEEKLILDTLVA